MLLCKCMAHCLVRPLVRLSVRLSVVSVSISADILLCLRVTRLSRPNVIAALARCGALFALHCCCARRLMWHKKCDRCKSGGSAVASICFPRADLVIIFL